MDKEWRGSKGRYRFECNLGHLFIARYASVARPNVSGIRCPVCRIQSRERDFIAFAKQVAHKREGKLVTKVWRGFKMNLVFKCKNDHEFKKTIEKLRYGKWCPYCPRINPH